MKTEDISDLFSQLKKGDEQAFRILFDMYFETLLYTARNIVKDVNTAKDVVQDVFLQIWKNRESIILTTSLEAYLRRSVINRSLSKIKSSKRITGDESLSYKASSDPSITDNLIAKDVQTIIDTTVEKLPERCRLIYTMKRIEGLKLKEIAAALDISPKTVENQLFKALRTLKEALLPYVNVGNNL